MEDERKAERREPSRRGARWLVLLLLVAAVAALVLWKLLAD